MTRTDRPLPQQIYKHFKGNLYQIHCIAFDSETGDEMVVYQALYGDYRFYVRKLEMFMSKTDKTKYPDAKQEYRFELVDISKKEDSAQTNNNGARENISQTCEDTSDIDSTDSCIKDESIYDESKTDPDVVKFWDAETYGQRIEVLDAMRHKITNEMIDLMSTVVDIEVAEDNDPQRRCDKFRDALVLRRSYETNRLR